MQYIPPTGSTDPDAPYVGANKAAGLQGSKVPPKGIEYPMREIVAVIVAAGLTPTNADRTQLLQAIRALAPNSDQVVDLVAQTIANKRLFTRTAPGTYDFVVPADVYWLYARCIGGGGGGGGNANVATAGPDRSGGGGGSGGEAAGWIQVTPGQTIAYVVGAGGAGAAVNAIASTGGTSSIGTSMQATGGGGGRNTSAGCNGGVPGLGSGGQLNLYGGSGGDGNLYNQKSQGGNGGSSSLGGGGRTGVGGAENGRAPGSGGGGCWGPADGTGGNGAAGFVSFEY